MAQNRKSIQPAAAVVLGGVILLAVIGTYSGWWKVNIIIGEFTLAHWIGWAGGAVIAVFVPLYSLLKRVFKIQSFATLSFHVFSNLTAFGLVAVHFAYQLSRPAGFGPDWGTGLGLLTVVSGIVLTGIVQRFGLAPRHYRKLRRAHIVLGITLVILLPLHILKNTGVI
jgi:hypothetical protein